MSVGSADLFEAINTAWTAAALDAKFLALRVNPLDGVPVLHDQEAAPKQPFPYCVMEVEKVRVTTRMSGDEGFKHELREFPVTFNVHADKVAGDARSAKAICAYLLGEVMKVYGGHPTTASSPLTMTNGGHLITQYVSDRLERTPLYKYQGILEYRTVLDVPVAV